MIVINDVNVRLVEEATQDALDLLPEEADAHVLYDRSFAKLEVTVVGADEAPIAAALTAKDWDVEVI